MLLNIRRLVFQRSRMMNQVNRQMSTSLRFIIDFDETLTANDTTGLIATLNSKNTSQWSAFEKKYFAEFKTRSDSALSRALSNKSMMSYFNDMAEFESISIKETIDGQFLRDISTMQLKELAKNIIPKEGMHSALTKLLEISGTNPIHVLSLSWSKLLIREFLSVQFPRNNSHFVIHANDLEVDSNGASNGTCTDLDLTTARVANSIFIGNIINGIHTAQDKANQVRQIRAEAGSENESTKFVCIGDSLNDLLALLSADYGIVLGRFTHESKLAQLCAVDHIRLTSITELDLASKTEKTIFIAEDWKQLIETLYASQKKLKSL